MLNDLGQRVRKLSEDQQSKIKYWIHLASAYNDENNPVMARKSEEIVETRLRRYEVENGYKI